MAIVNNNKMDDNRLCIFVATITITGIAIAIASVFVCVCKPLSSARPIHSNFVPVVVDRLATTMATS